MLEKSLASLDYPEVKHPVQRELTFGEKLVGLNFNPSTNSKVDEVKKLFAKAADILNEENISRESSQFSQRIFSHAVMEILNAQMNSVKFLTL
jgi:hypothetical protein